MQEILGYEGGFRFKEIKFNLEKEQKKLNINLQKSMERLVRKKRGRSNAQLQKNKYRAKTTKKQPKKFKSYVTPRKKTPRKTLENFNKIKQKAALAAKERGAGKQKSQKKKVVKGKIRKVTTRTKRNHREKRPSKTEFAKKKETPQMDYSESSEISEEEQKTLKMLESLSDQDEESMMSSNMDSVKKKEIAKKARLNIQNFWERLDMPRRRIISVKNTGVLCGVCLKKIEELRKNSNKEIINASGRKIL